MGLVSSRLNLEGLHSVRRRSQQDEQLYSYSLNKNYFSNYFLMGGERFEVNDPDYLFGDNCDLNFLSCTKPYSLPYKQAQQYLLANLNSKQKAINKVSSRVNRLNSPCNIYTGSRSGHGGVVNNLRKRDAQTQTLQDSKGLTNGLEPSRPLVMYVNIRKETLRLVKSSLRYSADNSDPKSLTNNMTTNSSSSPPSSTTVIAVNEQIHVVRPMRRRSLSKQSRKSTSSAQQQNVPSNRHSVASSGATTATICPLEESTSSSAAALDSKLKSSDSISSILSATSSTRSGYTSVKDEGISCSLNNACDSDVDAEDEEEEDDDEDFKDALNDTTIFSNRDEFDDDGSEKTQQQKSLLSNTQTKDNRDIKITIEPNQGTSASHSYELRDPSSNRSPYKEDAESVQVTSRCGNGDKGDHAKYSNTNKQRVALGDSTRRSKKRDKLKTDSANNKRSTSRVYNIEFTFDADVDCSIRIFYFCTRELTSTGLTYKPQHATYKSQIYYYKKGLDQKFKQPEHTFQPYLFDEDLLIYKPLDLDGNYNSGAVFPIVIHCVALEGPTPRQSHSLVATIEKSQLDDGYSIKPLKQLIFVDGVQYILQDIYGIEHKQLTTHTVGDQKNRQATKTLTDGNSSLKGKSHSLQSELNGCNLNLGETTSLASIDISGIGSRGGCRGSLVSQQHRSLGSENTFECVICMSEERDTMLLPCRHLCLCSSCAQSLRYQSSSCPICRCLFKAALNIRPIQRHVNSSIGTTAVTNNKSHLTSSTPTVTTTTSTCNQVDNSSKKSKENIRNGPRPQQTLVKNPSSNNNTKSDNNTDSGNKYEDSGRRRESLTTSTTPLLSAPLNVVVSLDGTGGGKVTTTTTAPMETVGAASSSSSSPYNLTNDITALTTKSKSFVDTSTKVNDTSSQSTSVNRLSQGGTVNESGGSLEMRSMNVHLFSSK